MNYIINFSKRLIFKILLIMLSTYCIGQTEVEKMANIDQISGRTWRALGPTLTNSIRKFSSINVTEELAEKYKLPLRDMRRFLRYTLNYTKDDLNSEKVLYRYPFFNTDSVQIDFDRLISHNLLEKKETSNNYCTSSLGNQILTSYWSLRIAQVESFNLLGVEKINTFYKALKKIILEANKLQGYGSRSVRVRIKSRPKNFNDLPQLIQVSELLREYTAFINDISHYKYDYFISQTTNYNWKGIKLTATAKELMSATRKGRVYDLNRCYSPSNYFRISQIDCDRVVQELIQFGFIKKNGNNISQTKNGAAISFAAEAFADQRRYSAWKSLTLNEYKNFVEGINWIMENLSE